MSAAPLWTSAAMAEAMRASINVALPDAVTGLSIDSRTIAPGEAYFAIKGEVYDGHDFVAAALKAIRRATRVRNAAMSSRSGRRSSLSTRPRNCSVMVAT